MLLATQVAGAQADPDRGVSGSGIQVKGWQGRTDGEGGLVFSRTVRGVTETHAFDAALL